MQTTHQSCRWRFGGGADPVVRDFACLSSSTLPVGLISCHLDLHFSSGSPTLVATTFQLGRLTSLSFSLARMVRRSSVHSASDVSAGDVAAFGEVGIFGPGSSGDGVS